MRQCMERVNVSELVALLVAVCASYGRRAVAVLGQCARRTTTAAQWEAYAAECDAQTCYLVMRVSAGEDTAESTAELAGFLTGFRDTAWEPEEFGQPSIGPLTVVPDALAHVATLADTRRTFGVDPFADVEFAPEPVPALASMLDLRTIRAAFDAPAGPPRPGPVGMWEYLSAGYPSPAAIADSLLASVPDAMPTSMTGGEVCSLMRKHKATIRGVAARMDVTMHRVRYVRARGLSDPLYVRSWVEAITQTGIYAPKAVAPC